ncbi:hypothetical protein GCM10027277_31770 [Pseudoduganella ginsengisoli]|uniref:HPr-rel-A system PqqD family peptide chaperone n=1 Tax=Pseudoduganella ginsengisoli TaxID=1462440 RepID=A0A6L6Q002_9BURK|nr:HPr-rel-A system PqqD family peptide chaperone [Pseudoduganella ginsengisoli]MTW02588.1 HPr-rel-A system PqqD family peptide chaperone [Pseudoduganella ginsengisoli]
MPALWRLTPGLTLRYRTWDNEAYVLYHNLTSDTHLMDAAAIEVLEALRSAPAPIEALAQALRLDASHLEPLSELLAELQEIALVECLPVPLPA